MSFFLVFLAIVLVGVVFWVTLGLRTRKAGGGASDSLLEAGFEQPAANLPPVLLPARAAPGDVDGVRFSLGLRGYRMDQVDQVLDELRDQLAAQQKEIDGLRTALLAAEAPVGTESGGNTAPGTDAL